jgi:hypothetical protein
VLYDFSIAYIKGTENARADILSRQLDLIKAYKNKLIALLLENKDRSYKLNEMLIIAFKIKAITKIKH